MNTDNMAISGETIDYGPCAFMDTYDPATVFSSIDHGGRYAYRNQPGIAHWNLACLAQALVPVLGKTEEEAIERAKQALDAFPGYFLDANVAGLRDKFGLKTAQADDEAMFKSFLDLLEENQTDFTLGFRLLSELAGEPPADSVSSLAGFPGAFNEWLKRWKQRCETEQHPDRQQAMLATNPAIIPRNHLIEAAIDSATNNEDFTLFHQLVDNLATPYTLSGKDPLLVNKPRPDEVVRRTFCGT